VIEARPNRTYRVELANGHRLLAFVAGQVKQTCAGFAVGDKVELQLRPYDLTMGRILVSETLMAESVRRFNSLTI